ncbi:cellulose biosynthesis protein BcsQ [Variovorax boronicumulans]|uniref:cellulose biosynthesis protein BcsQ n=1 Tax=Variovorax boronicumulans TaxID=436515 RepID=UPI00247489E8|nr:cellulose biosynthesis protein BcsQ [Variovorax boronicumulans]
MLVIPVISSKGGVGKTTVAANLSTALAERGFQVLAIDLDPQNALRFHLANDPGACEEGLLAAASGQLPWAQAMRPAHGGVVLLPFGTVDDERQIGFEHDLARHPGWLGDTLARFALPQDTVVIIDTPPGPTVYLQQALRAAHLCVVAVLADAGSFATLPIVERMVDKYCRPRADYRGSAYVINQVDPGQRLNHDVFAMLRARLQPELLGVLHLDASVSEALASALPVRRYAPLSKAAEDIAVCADRLLARLVTHPPAHAPPQRQETTQ